MEKRYQVFVSSTFSDLQEERQEVMQALLELNCIPSGMELFPAANDDQWKLIKSVIDDCDYYVVIVAGRYGSLSAIGMSYTEMEYRYALEKNKPILGFLHKDPASLPARNCDTESDKIAKLEGFRGLIKEKHVKFWTSPSDLGSVVSRGIILLTKSNPAIGWIRADRAASDEASAEILRLRRKVEELEEIVNRSRKLPPPNTAHLAQGRDKATLSFYHTLIGTDMKTHQHWHNFETTWNIIFGFISPLLLQEATEEKIKGQLETVFFQQNQEEIEKAVGSEGSIRRLGFVLYQDHLHTVIIQLRALGLIEKSVKPRSMKDTSTYWKLTEYGEEVMNNLRAIRRPEPPSEAKQ